jgi:cephalosporin hydroxylase
MNWDTVDAAATLANEPIDDEVLELVRAKVHGPRACYYVRFLHQLALALQPALAVELGTQAGITSAFLAAAGAGKVVGVDNAIRGKHLPAWYEGFTFLQMDSVDAAFEIAEMGEIDLLFQDTPTECHAAEWKMYRPLMADGALWICGDTNISGSWGLMEDYERREYAGLRGARILGVVAL